MSENTCTACKSCKLMALQKGCLQTLGERQTLNTSWPGRCASSLVALQIGHKCTCITMHGRIRYFFCKHARTGGCDCCICAVRQQLVGYHEDVTIDRQSYIEHSVIRTTVWIPSVHCEIELTILSHAIHDTNMASGVYMRGKLHSVTQTMLAEAASF